MDFRANVFRDFHSLKNLYKTVRVQNEKVINVFREGNKWGKARTKTSKVIDYC